MGHHKDWIRAVRPPRIASRKRLILGASIAQAIVLGVGWFWGFGLIRDRFELEVREYIVDQNAKLTDDIAGLFPSMLPNMLERGTQDWEVLQSIVENLSDLPGEGFACIIDDTNGELLCHPDIRIDETLYGSRLDFQIESLDDEQTMNRLPLLNAPDDEILSGRAQVTPIENHYVATKRLGESNLRLVVHQPKGALFKIGEQTTQSVALIAVFAGLGVITLSGFAVRAVVRRYDSFFEAANETMTENLLLAQRIQQSTLPSELPRVPGVDLAAWSKPADETGGDTYDVFESAPGQLTLLLADATGHGVGAALSVTQLRAMLRIALRTETDLVQAAANINEQLAQDLPEGRFITAWIAHYDSETRTLSSLALGHGPVMIYRAKSGTVEHLESNSWPLGVMDELGTDRVVRVKLEPGDTVLCASDGITEAMNAHDEQWGNHRLEEVLEQTRGAHAIATSIDSAVENYLAGKPAGDDRSVLVLSATALSDGDR